MASKGSIAKEVLANRDYSGLDLKSGYQEPDRTDNKNHINVLTVSKYEFTRNAYNGSGGFFDGYYLVPYVIETAYRERRELSTYKNFVHPVTCAMINPIFGKEITREIKAGEVELEDAMINGFLEDCNNQGHDIDTFMRDAGIEAVLQGGVFIVMDNVTIGEMGQTMADSVAARAYPYIYWQGQETVKKYSLDKYGRIQEIIFTAPSVTENGKESKRYRLWNDKYSVLMKEKVEGMTNSDLIEIEAPVFHGLGEIPVYGMYSIMRKSTEALVDPPLYDIAKINWAMFNVDSEQREVLRKQGFSQLCIQGEPSAMVKVGAGNVIWVAMDAKMMPQYASPDANIPRVLAEMSNEYRERLFEIAEQNGVTGVVAAKSGIAKEWDFRAHEFVLQRNAKMLKLAEEWIAYMFGRYTGENYDYIVSYPDSFGPMVTADEITQLDNLLMMNISPTANMIIKMRALKVKMPDIDEETMNKIKAEIETPSMEVSKNNKMDNNGVEDDDETDEVEEEKKGVINGE